MKRKQYPKTGMSPRVNLTMAALVLGAVLGSFMYRHYFSIRELSSGGKDAQAPLRVIEVFGDVSNPNVFFFDHAPTTAEVLAAHGEGLGSCLEGESHEAADYTLSTGTSIHIHRTQGGGVMMDFLQMPVEKRILFDIPLDLNAASQEDLVLIPGIGAGTAQEIVAYREKVGDFPTVAALKDVRGIGNQKFRKVQKYFFTKADLNQP